MLATVCLELINKPDVGRLFVRAYPRTGFLGTGAQR